MRGFFMRPQSMPGKRWPITWQQMRQRLAQEQLGQQKRQQLVLEQRQPGLEQQAQRLLLFCRKRTEQQRR